MKSGSCERPSQPPKNPPCGGPPAPSAVMYGIDTKGTTGFSGGRQSPTTEPIAGLSVGRKTPPNLAAVVAGQRGVDGRPVRVVHAVVRRANQGAAVDLARETGKVLAELNARQARGDRLELAADLRRGARLHVPHVEMAGPAVQEDQDARVGRRRKRGLAGGLPARAHVAPGASRLDRRRSNPERLRPRNRLPPNCNISRRETDFHPRQSKGAGLAKALSQLSWGSRRTRSQQVGNVKQFLKNRVFRRRGPLELQRCRAIGVVSGRAESVCLSAAVPW